MTQIVFLVLPPFQNVGRIRILYVKCAKDRLIDSYSRGFLVRYWFAVIDNILYRKLAVIGESIPQETFSDHNTRKK
jgi:hypothetical protein